ncbi:YfbK domain-containing protein [Lacinutrix undariae]
MKKFVIVLVLLISSQISAQQKTVSGTITSSSDGLGLPGVNVIIKGTSTGTQSDFDGNYTIKSEVGDILVFSFVSMITKEITVGSINEIDVALDLDSESLDEVVIVGYGTTKKRDVLGSISIVSSENIERKSSVEKALQGQVSGLQIVSASGNSDIKIRGAASVNNNSQPLYIVDGVPTSAAEVSKLDPNSIASVSVLKDAAATGIYGSRASQGVVVLNSMNGYVENPPYKAEDFVDDSYEMINENTFKMSQNSPLSTFSIDVDRASYSNVRRMINNGQHISANAVKIEEMVNYFNYNYAQPTDKHPFSIHTEVAKTPWNSQSEIVRIGLQGKTYNNDELPASNLTFLIDVSGSMSDQNKLPLLKSAFKLLVNQLRAKDKVAIVVYAGAAGVILPPTSGDKKETIINALENLESGGSTAGGEGIKLAYKLANAHFIKNGNNRVILATDGDFNVGASSNNAMEKLIEKERETGVFLSVLGMGYGNYKDSKLETLADKGNGNHAYIDTMQEAQKVFGQEFGGTLYTIAKDVKIQVEFNPKKVQAYRLIGYENRQLADEDFVDDTKDAGELGSGHTVTALYEIIPVGVESAFLESTIDLKYTNEKAVVDYKFSDELFTVKFRYKKPDGKKSIEMVHVQKDVISEASDDFKFASAVALFGMKLRQSQFDNAATYDTVLDLANAGRGDDKEGYRAEFIRLVASYKSM